jgi:hypothetical protein
VEDKIPVALAKLLLIVTLITGGQPPASLVKPPDVAPAARPVAAVRVVAVLAIYAVQTEDGRWHGEPELLHAGRFREAPTAARFSPPDRYNPFTGQTLTARYGEIGENPSASAYRLQVRQDNGSPLTLPVTRAVEDTLFGPPVLGTPEQRQQWEAAREQRWHEINGTS